MTFLKLNTVILTTFFFYIVTFSKSILKSLTLKF